MLRAIIFDFNGIILNDEPVHFRAMRDAVAGLGMRLEWDQYWERYLPLDDGRCFDAICADQSVSVSPAERSEALRRKVALYQDYMRNDFPLFPGSAEFVRHSALRYPLAVASGARRQEVEETLSGAGLLDCFRIIVAAEDFTLGKPHPESFLLALRHLNERLDGSSPIRPRECLVVEDSVGGVQGSRAAGMRCLAVSNTYTAGQLAAASADRVVASLDGLTVESLQDLFEDPS